MALGDNARYKLYPSVRLVRCYLPALGYAIPPNSTWGGLPLSWYDSFPNIGMGNWACARLDGYPTKGRAQACRKAAKGLALSARPST